MSAAPDDHADEQRPRVVVGVDGSPSSKDALRWASDYARACGGTVVAVTAWFYPMTFGYAPVITDEDLDENAAKMLDDTIADALGPGGADIVRKVVEGYPAPTLLDEARSADLLVVGSRGHGAFAGMLIGSVSQHCAQQAACPVVIVRHGA